MNEGISTSICKLTAFRGEVMHLLLSGRLSKVKRALVLTYGMCGNGVVHQIIYYGLCIRNNHMLALCPTFNSCPCRCEAEGSADAPGPLLQRPPGSQLCRAA